MTSIDKKAYEIKKAFVQGWIEHNNAQATKSRETLLSITTANNILEEYLVFLEEKHEQR